MLAIPAWRGNPAAVGVVLAVVAGVLLLSIASFVFLLVLNTEALWMAWQLVIPLLILIVLARSRNVLLELTKGDCGATGLGW